MQDLLETTHFLTRVKVAPGAEGFFDGGSSEAQRAVLMAGKLSVASLTRAWQMLLKGLLEVRDAANPLPAAEMALVRLAYAADLPPTEQLLRHLRDGESSPAHASPPAGVPRGPGPGIRAQAQAQASPRPSPEHYTAPQPTASLPAIDLARLEDIAALAKTKGARLLATQLENSVHLVSLERGRIEFRPSRGASGTLASDLSQRLRDWTGERWIVTLASEGGALTIYEQRQAAEQARKDAVSQEPFVRAVLDTFPGAEIVAVRERENDTPPPLSDEESA
jgi:DNA polymerase-3 subunit gamma/tau